MLAELSLTDTLIWQGSRTMLPSTDGDGNIGVSQTLSPQHTCVSLNAPLALFVLEMGHKSHKEVQLYFLNVGSPPAGGIWQLAFMCARVDVCVLVSGFTLHARQEASPNIPSASMTLKCLVLALAVQRGTGLHLRQIRAKRESILLLGPLTQLALYETFKKNKMCPNVEDIQ